MTSPSDDGSLLKSTHVSLSQLLPSLSQYRINGAADVVVRDLCYRSDQVRPGSLFFCVPGFVRDGHDFAPDAVARGALALCVERELGIPVAQVVVPSVRRAMGPLAAAFHGYPSSRLLVVGITGTNGKTTSSYLLAHLLDSVGLRAGLVGTVERRVGGVAAPAARTTPEAVDVQRDLAAMVKGGDRAAVLEVSSHALDLGRVLGVRFSAIAFTNLTQDHLDYHGTFEAYFAAKRMLFAEPAYTEEDLAVVINIDDEYGRRLASEHSRGRLITFSILPRPAPHMTKASELEAAYLSMHEYTTGVTGTTGTLVAADGRRYEVRSPLVGAFNVANTLTALGLGWGLGLDLEEMLVHLQRFPGVPGRMERVDVGQPFGVFVDYAHTPDSVRNVLQSARSLTEGRLIAVLGCGGDRDRGKRPLMGREAESLADEVFVTSDNPRSEEPVAIMADILAGMKNPRQAVVEVDRQVAIATAVNHARAGDIVLILGKGHESGQEFADYKIPFDDRAVARQALEHRAN